MAVNLQKGGNTSLTSSNPGLKKIIVGLGWDGRATAGDDFDLDASAFILNESGKVRRDDDFIFYNKATSQCGSVKHLGDNLTGAGDGDDEQVEIDLSKIQSDVKKVAVCVSIHEAVSRRQNFGMVQNAFIRVIDASSNEELARFDLSEDFSIETSVVFGEIYKHNEEWKFKAIGQGYSGGLENLLANFGISL